MMIIKMPPIKNTLLQAATRQPTKQRLQESIFSPNQEKLENKKIPMFKKIKYSNAQYNQDRKDS